MLCYKLVALPIAYTLRTTNSQNNVILHFTKMYVSFSTLIQLRCQMQSSNNVTNSIIKENILENDVLLKTTYHIPLIVNSESSKNFVTLIKDDLLQNMSHVIELNPGFGLLSETLLNAGIPFIHLYEKRTVFAPYLQSLKDMFPNRVNIITLNLLSLPKMINLIERHNNDLHMHTLENNFPIRTWEEKSNVQIVGIVSEYSFLRHLILSVVFQTGFMSYGRPIFYFAILPNMWDALTSYKKCGLHKRTTYPFMFNLLFNYTTFGTIDTKGILLSKKRQQSNDKIKTRFNNVINNSFYYVVKIEPKTNIFKVFDKSSLVHFWYFIRHYFRKKSRVIPELEKLIPGIGVRLIQRNYNIFTLFQELSDDEIIDLYMELENCSGFKESILITSANELMDQYNVDSECENN